MENDWATQLRKIEREFDGLPPEPSPASLRMQTEAERRANERAAQRAAAFGATARFVLVLALAAALTMWPYERACGSGLFSYLAAEGMIIAGGLWIVSYTWRHRLPRAHTVALLLTLAGMMAIAWEVLPRIGYAQTDPRNPPTWWCETS